MCVISSDDGGRNAAFYVLPGICRYLVGLALMMNRG